MVRAKKKILVIDDDPDILESIQLILTNAGYDTCIVSRGDEAYDKARDYLPDLVITDYLISGMDGIKVSQDLRQSFSNNTVPVIMVSAHPNARLAAQRAGIGHFLDKPFKVKQLVDQVKALID